MFFSKISRKNRTKVIFSVEKYENRLLLFSMSVCCVFEIQEFKTDEEVQTIVAR